MVTTSVWTVHLGCWFVLSLFHFVFPCRTKGRLSTDWINSVFMEYVMTMHVCAVIIEETCHLYIFFSLIALKCKTTDAHEFGYID